VVSQFGVAGEKNCENGSVDVIVKAPPFLIKISAFSKSGIIDMERRVS
jgi:hypothetical protein